MDYDLVFEGGGAKGMVFIGALQEFESLGHQHGRILGTSAGAIVALLLTAGYTSNEMLSSLNEKLPDGNSVFTSFMATPGPFDRAAVIKSSIRNFLHAVNIPFIPDFIEEKMDDAIVEKMAETQSFRHIFSFVERGGWYSADNFLNWLKIKLDSGSFNGNPRKFSGMTLRQFFEATGTELSLIASDTTSRQMLVLNHSTAPDCPVAWAARMSMSVPLLWQEVIWQSDWGTYLGRNINGDAIVDGGLLSNFPIELFLSDLKDVTDVMGSKTSQNVLGFLIDDDLAVLNAPELVETPPVLDIANLVPLQRISRLIDTTLSARDKMVIDSYANLVVRMPAKGFGTTEFNMTDQRRIALVEAGQQALRKYFYDLEHPALKDVSFGFDAGEADNQTVINRIASKIIK